MSTHNHVSKLKSLVVVAAISSLALIPEAMVAEPGVAILLVDTDRVMGKVEEAIYGHFLEHINHSVVDGLFAEQIQGQGFEGKDFETYWKVFGNNGSAKIVAVKFESGEKSLRLEADNGTVGIQQGRIYLQAGHEYDGFAWIKPEAGTLQISFRVTDSTGALLAEVPLKTSGSNWQQVAYSFSSPKTDTKASVKIAANGKGAVLLDFISMMRTDIRKNGMLRPDLVQAIRDLRPPFIRWPGGCWR